MSHSMMDSDSDSSKPLPPNRICPNPDPSPARDFGRLLAGRLSLNRLGKLPLSHANAIASPAVSKPPFATATEMLDGQFGFDVGLEQQVIEESPHGRL